MTSSNKNQVKSEYLLQKNPFICILSVFFKVYPLIYAYLIYLFNSACLSSAFLYN